MIQPCFYKKGKTQNKEMYNGWISLQAFDKVSHNLLKHKLNICAIEGCEIIAWIQRLLSLRTQSVIIGGDTPGYVHVKFDVPNVLVLSHSSFYY